MSLLKSALTVGGFTLVSRLLGFLRDQLIALIKDPISAISVGMALMFGTAGLPHILVRFYTVPDAKTARVSLAATESGGAHPRAIRTTLSRAHPACPGRPDSRTLARKAERNDWSRKR